MQKFKKGDHVRIDKDLGKSISHFRADCEAIVIGSYADQYGGTDTKSYTLHIKNSGQTSWYDECQLTLIEPGRVDLLDEWEAAQQSEKKLKSDLDWIFEHGPEVLESPHGASIQALADCFGLTDLWGSRGEGFDLWRNSRQTLLLAKPYLVNNDKKGWVNLCESAKALKGEKLDIS